MDVANVTEEKKLENEAQDAAEMPSREKDAHPSSADQELSSSIAGISLQPESAKRDGAFLDTTPKTPPMPSPMSQRDAAEASQEFDEKRDGEDMFNPSARTPQKLDLQDVPDPKTSEGLNREAVSSPEIKNIMDQFEPSGSGSGEQDNDPVQARLPENLLGKEIRHPPRSSSLEPITLPGASHAEHHPTTGSSHFSAPPVDSPQAASFTHSEKQQTISTPNHSNVSHPRQSDSATPMSGRPPSLNKALPPEPDPEPDLPFDFHRFLEQLRHRSADPVAKFLRSFLIEFSKKQWMAHEQTKIISDFLAFITNKMAQCEVWQGVSDAEFDNAREGMEKLVMNRLYTQTFSPAIPPPSPDRGKRRPGDRGPGPGRRGQHQEDVERDSILSQKIQIYQWVREEHLDLKPVSESGRRFLILAQQGMCQHVHAKEKCSYIPELSKIKSYRAPRDKVICVLNCCKVIFGSRSCWICTTDIF